MLWETVLIPFEGKLILIHCFLGAGSAHYMQNACNCPSSRTVLSFILGPQAIAMLDHSQVLAKWYVASEGVRCPITMVSRVTLDQNHYYTFDKQTSDKP